MQELRALEHATLSATGIRSGAPDKERHAKIKARCLEILRRAGAPRGVSMKARELPDGRLLLRSVYRDGTEWEPDKLLPGTHPVEGRAESRAEGRRQKYLGYAANAEKSGFDDLALAWRRAAARQTD